MPSPGRFHGPMAFTSLLLLVDVAQWKYSLGLDIEYGRAEGRLALSHRSYLAAFFGSLPFKC